MGAAGSPTASATALSSSAQIQGMRGTSDVLTEVPVGCQQPWRMENWKCSFGRHSGRVGGRALRKGKCGEQRARAPGLSPEEMLREQDVARNSYPYSRTLSEFLRVGRGGWPGGSGGHSGEEKKNA